MTRMVTSPPVCGLLPGFLRPPPEHPPPPRDALCALLSASWALSGSPATSVGDSRCPEGAASPPGHHERVDENVPDKNRKTGYQPPPLGHHAGVDQRSDVVLDKSALIASLTCQVSKSVLQRCERTNLAEKVHVCRPQDRRDVKPGDPNLPKYKQAAQDRKNNKGEVKSQDKIPQCACRHLLILVRNSSWPPNSLHHEDLSMPS